jgi:hypothetical protein
MVFSAMLIAFISVASAQEKLQYHVIKKDKEGKIIPWYNPIPASPMIE